MDNARGKFVTQSMIDQYLKEECNGRSEADYFRGYMDDGHSEDAVEVMLIDNVSDYFKDKKAAGNMDTREWLQVRGTDEKNNLHFTIIRQYGDGSGGQGVDVLHKHFYLRPDGSVKSISYLTVLDQQPLKDWKKRFYRENITRALGGLVDYFIELV